jgi:hypothetical protein
VAIKLPIRNIGINIVNSIPYNIDLQSKMRQELRDFRQRQIENLMSHETDNIFLSPADQLRKIEINLYMDSIDTSDTALKEFRQEQIQVLATEQKLISDLSDEDFQKMFFDDDGIIKTTPVK